MHSLNPPLAHRDLKTPNIFLAFNTPLSSISADMALSHPLAKVGDFGLSQFTYFDLKSTKGKGVMGHINPQWTAPEVLHGQPYSVQSDVYSLGLLLWEIKYRKMAYWDIEEGMEMGNLRSCILTGVRPKVNGDDEYDRLCMERWIDNPLNRPDASDVVEKLSIIIQSNAPLLAHSIPALINEKIDVSQTQQTKITISHSLQAKESISVKDCRIVCSTFTKSSIWFGCRNGKIGLFNIHDGSLIFADDDLCGTKCVVNCIQYIEKSHTVWTGNNCGELIAWNAYPVSGKIAAEEIAWQGFVKKGWPLRFDGEMTLRSGTLTWHGHFFENLFHTMIQDIVSVSEIDETSFTVVSKTDRTTYTSPMAKHLITLINCCISYNSRSLVLTKRAERRVGLNDDEKSFVPVIALAEIDGNAWSLDGQLMLTEWTIEVNHAGVTRSVLELHPQRCLKMNGGVLKRDGCAAVPVGMWSVCGDEVWVGVGNQFICVSKNSVISLNEPPLSQKDCIQNCWKQLSEGVCANDLMILCGVVVVNVSVNEQNGVELWVSTGLGVVFIWDVEKRTVKRVIKVEKMISTMIVVEDEVCVDQIEFNHKYFCLFCFSHFPHFIDTFSLGVVWDHDRRDSADSHWEWSDLHNGEES